MSIALPISLSLAAALVLNIEVHAGEFALPYIPDLALLPVTKLPLPPSPDETTIISHDIYWSSFNDYLTKLQKSVTSAWRAIRSTQKKNPPAGSWVSVDFILDSTGAIKSFVLVKPSADMTSNGQLVCLAALRNPAPFGKWTEDMVKVLGPQQGLTFTFVYR